MIRVEKLSNLTIQELIEYDKVHFVKPWIAYIKQDLNNNLKKLCGPIDWKYCEYRNNLPIKQELTRSYHELLDKILTELDTLSLNSDTITPVITLSNFLIPNAYLSRGDTFQKSFDDGFNNVLYFYSDLVFCDGYYIINGNGVCRHVNNFICDILKYKGIETYLVGGEIWNLKTSKEKYKINHTVIATAEKHQYHLIDGFNQSYSILEGNEYFYDNDKVDYAFVPHFIIKEHYLHSYKNPFYLLPYQEIISPNEQEERIKDIYKIMLSTGYQRFNQFKQNNLELYERINNLTNIEFNRTLCKELKKIL